MTEIHTTCVLWRHISVNHLHMTLIFQIMVMLSIKIIFEQKSINRKFQPSCRFSHGTAHLCFFFETGNGIERHVLHWNRKGMKHENPKMFMDSVKLCLRSTRKNFGKCTENENYQFSICTVFSIFIPQKRNNYQKLSIFYSLYSTSLIIYKIEVMEIIISPCSWTKI